MYLAVLNQRFIVMKILNVLLCVVWIAINTYGQHHHGHNCMTPYEHDTDSSANYKEVVDYYRTLDSKYDMIRVEDYGMTDSGNPLQVVVIDIKKQFDPAKIKEEGRVILFINNGIHPGEPCGIDASMMLARDLVKDSSTLLHNTVIVIIPVYNIGGCLNRSGHSRANQNGPKLYGFRGNAKNLDLNRDFIKADSKNAQSFNQLYAEWSPDVFVDTHTSNGADYQYIMTLIATQRQKIAPSVSKLLAGDMLPFMYERMEKKDFPLVPYVMVKGTPDSGIYGFMDYARYSSGYAALHHSLGFIPEAHMLKPYKDRVEGTYTILVTILEYMDKNNKKIIDARAEARRMTAIQDTFVLDWEMDVKQHDTLLFKGYEAGYKDSKVTQKKRLYYDHTRPYEKHIPYFNRYKPSSTVLKPRSYIIPQGYTEVIDRLKANKIQMTQLEKDSTYTLEMYRILDFKNREAYEGHYMHHSIEVEKNIESVKYYRGDYIVNTDQALNKYIVETLEPHAPDSFFAWNFFDGILMQKEYFSPYVFEDKAKEILDADPSLREELERKKKEDPEFANNDWKQLLFVYQRSPYFEKTYRRYPVGRIP